MKSVMGVPLAIALMIMTTGCNVSDSYSKNMRASTAQATANVATKAMLDEVSADKYDATKAKTVEVCAEVAKFLETGKIGDLPIDAARDAVVSFMTKKGWAQYVPMVIAVFDIVSAQTVPVEKLGADNIAIIQMGLNSAIVSAETSRVEWRRPASKDMSTAGALPFNRVSFFRSK